jgi:hypothetical protein
MKLRPHSVLQGMAGALMCLAVVAGAQTTSETAPPSTTAADSKPATATDSTPAPVAPPAAPVWSVGSLDFSGYVDGYYSYNYNRPGQNVGQTNQLYNFDDATDQFSLEAAKLTINHDPDPVGAHVDILFGRTNSFLHGSGDNTDDYIEQAYLSIKPAKAKGLEMDFGQFVTSAGQEVIETMNNWSYSHGILFGYAIPYYHFGLRTTMPITKSWTGGVQVVNGWNNTIDNNGGVTIGVTSSVVKPKYTWNANYYTGPENYNTQKGYRNLFDTTILLTPTAKFNAYFNYDYGQNKTSAYTAYGDGPYTVPETDLHWQGIATSAREQITAKAALVGRYEYFFDQGAGNATGVRQYLDEFTGTYEYKWLEGLLLRAEYRRDWSNKKFFYKGDQGNSVKAQSTVTIGMIAFFGPKR